MSQLKNLLVPIDFSEYSEHAYTCALDFAQHLDAHLTLFHVEMFFHPTYPEEGFQIDQFETEFKEHQHQIMEQIRALAEKAEKKGISVDYELVRGYSVAEKILEHIEENQFDLVMMGTHGRTGLKHFFLGSIAERMVRLSPIPVLTVHKECRRYPVKKILVSIDFSEYSKLAEDYAKMFSQLFKAEIVFLHVVERVVYPTFYPEAFIPVITSEPDFHDRLLENLNAFVTKNLQSTSDKVIEEGTPSDKIIEYAENNDIDLIIMATRGLTGLEHLMVGSTAERVVRLSKTPVLTVRKTNDQHNSSADTTS